MDRRTILLEVITLIERNDLRHLTMRRLGAQLGVEGMALNHYIHGREDLLDGIVELVIDTRPPAAPWVRPPLRSLRWMESFLENTHRRGFTDSGAVAAYRAFSSSLFGHLLLDVSARGADISPIEEADLRPVHDRPQ